MQLTQELQRVGGQTIRQSSRSSFFLFFSQWSPSSYCSRSSLRPAHSKHFFTHIHNIQISSKFQKRFWKQWYENYSFPFPLYLYFFLGIHTSFYSAITYYHFWFFSCCQKMATTARMRRSRTSKPNTVHTRQAGHSFGLGDKIWLLRIVPSTS